MFGFDPLYLLVIGIGMGLSLWASARVKWAFARYSKVPTRAQVTGAQVAERILAESQVQGVKIETIRGELSDHYDPRSHTLRLSEKIFSGRSLAAVGVAAHEAGHAIQHATGNPMLAFRSRWVPMANLGSRFSFIVLILAMIMGGMASLFGSVLALAGVGLFALTTVFTLITLPVEFDASRRALQSLERGQHLGADELAGARKVLNAAALTYVAAFVTSLMTLLYWAFRLGLLGGRRSG